MLSLRAHAALLAALPILTSSPATAQAPPPGLHLVGSFNTDVRGLSPEGSVAVGALNAGPGQNHAFRWSFPTGLTNLPALLPGDGGAAVGASTLGSVIVGLRSPAGGDSFSTRAARWTDSGPQALGVPAGVPADAQTDVWGVSGTGLISAGRVWTAPGSYRAVQWNGTTATFLPVSGGGQASLATDVSNDGSVIVGWGGSFSRPKRWTNGIEATLSIGDALSGSAQVVSGNGLVTGGTVFSNGEQQSRIAIWPTPASAPTIIAPATSAPQILDISGNGAVAVGYYSALGTGWVWTPSTGMLSATAYFALQGFDVSNWQIGAINAVSDDGLVFAGRGRFNGQNSGFVISVPAPGAAPALMLPLLLAAANRTRRRAS